MYPEDFGTIPLRRDWNKPVVYQQPNPVTLSVGGERSVEEAMAC